MIVMDLDRSIIYSKRVLEMYNYMEKPVIIEYKDGKPLSYTTTSLIECLMGLKYRGEILVANTARGLKQVKRLNIYGLFDYIIYANGGHILHNNELVNEYENYIKCTQNEYTLLSLYKRLDELASSYLHKYDIKIIDNTYLVLKSEREISYSKIIETALYDNKTYNYIINKNSLYIFNNSINKGIALDWLSKGIQDKVTLAIGDSLLDIPMLQLAKVTAIPKHSELISKNLYKPDFILPAGLDGSTNIRNIIGYSKRW